MAGGRQTSLTWYFSHKPGGGTWGASACARDWPLSVQLNPSLIMYSSLSPGHPSRQVQVFTLSKEISQQYLF